MYVPWKFPTKILIRSAQLWINHSGRCPSEPKLRVSLPRITEDYG
jgi:hypothetical protein